MADEPKQDDKDPTKIQAKNLEYELLQKTQAYDELKIKYDALVEAHKRVLDHIDEGNRAVLMDRLKKATKLTDQEMMAMDTAELQRLVDSYALLKQPVAGIRPAGDIGEADSRFYTVPPKFRYGGKAE